MSLYRKLFLAASAIRRITAIPPPEFGFVDSGNHTELSVAYTFNNNVTVVQEGQLFGGNSMESRHIRRNVKTND